VVLDEAGRQRGALCQGGVGRYIRCRGRLSRHSPKVGPRPEGQGPRTAHGAVAIVAPPPPPGQRGVTPPRPRGVYGAGPGPRWPPPTITAAKASHPAPGPEGARGRAAQLEAWTTRARERPSHHFCEARLTLPTRAREARPGRRRPTGPNTAIGAARTDQARFEPAG